MAVTETTPPDTHAPTPPAATAPRRAQGQGELEQLIGSGDHTSIGRLYIGFALLFLLAALISRVVTGLDAATDNGILGVYEQMVSTSSTVALVFLGVVPLLLGLAIHIVPLQLGSPTIAFPRAAALSLWSWVVFSAIFITSLAVDGGIGGGDVEASRLGNVALAGVMVALALGSVCIATTVIAHRPAGMWLARVPLFSWSMLVAAVVWIVTIGSAVAHSVIGHIAADTAPAFFENFATGLAWLLRAPAVYMLAIPVLGIAADVVAASTKRPLRNYGVFQGMIGAFAVLAFGAWAQTGAAVNTVLFALWALAIFLPLLGLLGGLGESMRHGRVPISAALVGSLLALVNLLGAAVIGLLMVLDTVGTGTVFDFEPTALALSQAAFVITAGVAGALSGIAHWAPKVWGDPAQEPMATASIGMVDVGGGLLAIVFAVQTFVQAGGKDTADALFGGLEALGALLFAVGVVGSLVAYLGAARGGGPEPHDGGLTLEWLASSPARGGEVASSLPEITSPYPLAETPPPDREDQS